MPGKFETNSRCDVEPEPAISAKMDNSNLTRNGEITVFCLLSFKTFCKKNLHNYLLRCETVHLNQYKKLLTLIKFQSNSSCRGP